MTQPREMEQPPSDCASPAAPAPAVPENAGSGSHSAQAAPPRPSRVRKVTTKTLHQFTDTKQLVTVMMDAIKGEFTLVLDHPIIHQRQRLERKRELTTPRPHGPHQPTELFTKWAESSTATSTTTPLSLLRCPTATPKAHSSTLTCPTPSPPRPSAIARTTGARPVSEVSSLCVVRALHMDNI